MITVSRDALFSDRADTAEYKLKENQIFLASERMVGVGEGQNPSFHIFLLTISSLSRRRGSREFKEKTGPERRGFHCGAKQSATMTAE